LSDVQTKHSKLVKKATTDASAASANFNKAHNDYGRKKSKYDVERATVSQERANTKKTEAADRQTYANDKNKLVSEAKSLQQKTVKRVQETARTELALCAATEKKRLSLLGKDESVINELAPLINKLEACKGTKATGTKATGTSFFEHPAEMACKRGGSWKRPNGNGVPYVLVKSTKEGVESCESQCKAGGFKYFNIECPMLAKGKVHCQCASVLGSSKKQDPKQCSGGGKAGHCTGPFVTEEGGYSLGGHSLGSIYLVTATTAAPTTAAPKVKATMGSKTTIGGGAGCTGTKAPGRPNICLWDSKRCVNRYDQCGILESKALQVCADWDECGGVVCKSAYRGYCLARKKIDGRTKRGMWAYKKSGRDGSGNVILLEETTSKREAKHSGVNNFMEMTEHSGIEMNAEAACAVNDDHLSTYFLERIEGPSSTSGSFSDWKKRLVAEKSDANGIRKTCDDDATSIRTKETDSATKRYTKSHFDANADATRLTKQSNDDERKANGVYDRRVRAVKDPYTKAKAVARTAKSQHFEANNRLNEAKKVQKDSVRAQKRKRSKRLSDADQKRNHRISQDKLYAQKIDSNSLAKHQRLTTTKKEECEHESSLLRQERIKIKAIIGELDMLKIAGGGLNKEDAGKTITEDIQYLESKIEEETVSSEKDWKTCLSNSENDEAKEMKSANGAYSDAEKKLVATNVKEEAKYGRTLKSKTKQSKQRLAASQGTLNEAVSRHNDASNKNKKAQQKLKIAQEFQFDEVATSKTIRITELKRAADKKARYIADKNEEAKETRDDAQETFDAHTTSKNEECSTERGILKEEKDTLKLTSMKIGKLQVVDNTAADNKAAAEKAAADKAAAEKAAAKKAAADKAAAKKAAADKAAAEKAAAEKAAADKAAAEKAAAEKTFFHHPAEMACKSGGSWKRPYGNVKSTKAGFESCGSKCKAGGFKYFGLECPMMGPRGDKGKVHCQCSSDLSSSNKQDPKQCSGAVKRGHCNGPFVTEGGYSLGAYNRGSVYSVSSYYITEKNENCAVTGNVITSKEECAFALKKVGKSDRFVWNSVHKGIPGGCSVRGSADGHYDNRGLQGTVGEKRGDLRAVCKGTKPISYSVWPNAYSVWPNHPSATKVGANGIPLSWCTERQNKPFNQGGPRVKGGNFGGGKATWCIAAKTNVGKNCFLGMNC